MRRARGLRRSSKAAGIVGAGLIILGFWSAVAARPPGPTPRPTPSTTKGRYCGGDGHETRGATLQLTEFCKSTWGPESSAALTAQHAHGWVCKVPGKSTQSLSMQAVCRRAYGSEAVATLVGVGPNDWRCLRPADVKARFVPVLLLPVAGVSESERKFVQDAVQRVERLLAGVRRFYRDKAGEGLEATNAFVLPTQTSATEWQSLAAASTQDARRFDFHDRVKREFERGGWGALVRSSGAKVAGFVNLGSKPPTKPTWLGAASDDNGSYLSQPPSNSYASCSTAQTNPDEYENAFYAVAHELGHTLGLKHTDEYVYGPGLSRPANWQRSIMYQGDGTRSELFDFEARALREALKRWK